VAGSAVPPGKVHATSDGFEVPRIDATPPQPIRILRADSRGTAAQVVQLPGLPVGADEQEVHQAVNEPVVAVHEAMGITVFVHAAGPQPAARLGVWLNEVGKLLQKCLKYVWRQPLQGQRLVPTAVSELYGGGWATRLAALLDALAPCTGSVSVAEPAGMVGPLAAWKAAFGPEFFGQGLPPRCHAFEGFVRFAQQRFALLALGLCRGCAGLAARGVISIRHGYFGATRGWPGQPQGWTKVGVTGALRASPVSVGGYS